MRKALLATLALAPVMLHAQANSPAQPKLESRLDAPNEIAAAAGERTVTTKSFRVSTGVVAPKLVQSSDIAVETPAPLNFAGPHTVIVGMTVSATGVPTDLKIVQSAGPQIDRNVLNAVARYRFKPGTVSNRPVDFPVNLEINLIPSSR